ncbi:5-formyltetrahydrofolate cyclo-ligase [Bifidobacterium sp. SMB2]|uniref:5-formyltetrahydrofolate cyclo-ligase n=1 Tax=Bifidobacterium saimiriisciurei TaxID=2661627 RepID=A0ABX0C753_9BIFI|nr:MULTISPECIES: 5-formyltetrahydrofolate cyclo-ligase [Bifidobacterium]NEG96390.1 5-formyltetrahydrofolate cyclo-ligase [Bifidobacterium sp. SMB2]NEH10978.1 5-formyltetrahydrofolate cyclo-ligase [Bifidobacterium saimiriisciurei]
MTTNENDIAKPPTDGGTPNDGRATDDTDIVAAKTELRHEAFRRRREVDDEARARAGADLADQADRSGLFDGVRTVAAYVSMGTEVPTTPLLRRLIGRGIRVLVPRLGSGRELGWSELTDVDDLRETGDHRPQEPDGAVQDADAIRRADVVVTAAVLADRGGVRLGRGGGWYDQALTHRRPGTPVVAVVWPWELRDAPLPHEPHDQRVDGVLTPAEYWTVR